MHILTYTYTMLLHVYIGNGVLTQGISKYTKDSTTMCNTQYSSSNQQLTSFIDTMSGYNNTIQVNQICNNYDH